MPLDEIGPWPDPFAWRHSWSYRVQPDGSVSLLLDEGDQATEDHAADETTDS